MKNLRWQLIIIFLTGLVVGILLLGEQPGKNISILGPQAQAGGVYTEGLVGTLQRLNPVLDMNNTPDRDLDRLIFSGLVKFDSRGIAKPDLAESIGISKDGLNYNISLHADARWHDGQPVTADDVLFTVDLLRQGGPSIPTDLQEFWKKVEVQGKDKTLQFRLPEPFSPFLDYLSFGVLPRHLLVDVSPEQMLDAPFNLQPIGSGPFQFERLIIENGQITGIALKAFSDYYGNKPLLGELVFLYFPSSTSALQAYKDKKVQGLSEVSAETLPLALGEPNLAFYSSRKPELAMVLLNLKNPETAFFQDIEVRKALMMALNRQRMVDRILSSQAILADGPIFPDTWAYYNGTTSFGFNSENARDKLISTGYVLSKDTDTIRSKSGVSLKFKMIYPDDESHKNLAEAIKKDMLVVNVEVDLEPLNYDQLVNERLLSRDYQAALVDLNLSRSPDPDPYPFWDQVQATSGQNYSQWDNRAASEYLEQARVSIDLAERTRLYRNFQVIFSDELPALPLFYPVYTFAVDKQIQGIRMGPLFDTSDRFTSVLDWYIVAKPLNKPGAIQTNPTAIGTP